MFKFIKSLFGDNGSVESVSKSSSLASEPAAALAEAPQASVSPAAASPRPIPRRTPKLPAGPYIELPLVTVTSRLAAPLQSRLARPPQRADLVKLSLSTVLEQLPRGAVRICFRELREGSPPGTFAEAADLDETLVDVPLPEILSRLKPTYLARRADQKRFAAPDNLPAVFASRGSKSSAAQVKPITLPTDALSGSRLMSQAAGPEFAQAPAARPTPAPAPQPEIKMRPVMPPTPSQPRPAGVAEPEAKPGPTPKAAEPIKAPLVSLARNWPEALRREILSAHLADAVNIPFAELEAAMKRGQVVFSWKQLRLWMHPKPSTALTEHDAVALELPLPVIVPLFLARRSDPAPAPKMARTDDIPDVFQVRKASEAAPVADAAPVARETEPAPAVQSLQMAPTAPVTPAGAAATSPASPDQLTVARSSALPTQTVQKACHLSGVAGALLATTDGLVIASQLPSGMNAEAAAGLLPQIFSRLGQYTKGLKLGEPSQLEVLVENVPLHIIKTPHAYFAILGKNAEPLPKLQLSALAKQFSQRPN